MIRPIHTGVSVRVSHRSSSVNLTRDVIVAFYLQPESAQHDEEDAEAQVRVKASRCDFCPLPS